MHLLPSHYNEWNKTTYNPRFPMQRTSNHIFITERDDTGRTRFYKTPDFQEGTNLTGWISRDFIPIDL